MNYNKTQNTLNTLSELLGDIKTRESQIKIGTNYNKNCLSYLQIDISELEGKLRWKKLEFNLLLKELIRYSDAYPLDWMAKTGTIKNCCTKLQDFNLN
ncbi:MAG: hypothetical protein JKY53_15095 [Flavobacteriales bacterium]|nr:hypothetical protein [Flavobacteriales bacterium]